MLNSAIPNIVAKSQALCALLSMSYPMNLSQGLWVVFDVLSAIEQAIVSAIDLE